MTKKRFTGITILLLLFSMVGFGNASIVNINAKTNSTTNPVVMFFETGTYDVIPIGVADGGAYNAWNAWLGGLPPSYAGWLNNYSLSSSEFNAYTVTDNTIYPTDILALQNALSTTFTLSSSGSVNFFIVDNPYYDNVGGISLDINAVPLPAAIWLLGSGLLGFVGIRKKIISKI